MDRTELLIEADRRGLLKPEQKAELDDMLKRGAAPEPSMSQQAGQFIGEIPRTLGRTARTAIKGVAAIPTMMADVVAAPLRLIPGQEERPSPSQSLDSFLTRVGLPEPQNETERLTEDVGGMLTGQGALVKGGQALANVGGPVVKRIGQALSSNPVVQGAGAAGSGAAGGLVREGGGGPVEQFAASVAGGLSTAGAAALVGKVYNGVASAIGQVLKPNQSMAQINIVLNQILQQNGIDVSQVPAMIRAQLAHEVRKSLDTGGQLNPDVVRRIADYGVVGATPTRGSVTLDPVQITQEKNLAKVGANSSDERLQELARLQNANNARMIEFLNVRGGGTSNANPVTAGTAAERVITERDARMGRIENELYNRARDSQGRQIELDSQGFVTQAYNNLGQSGKGAFLPAPIKARLEELWLGKTKLPDGTEVAIPFNVDVMDNLKTTLAAASRAAERAGDGNAKAAIAQVRNALENVQPRAQGRAPTGGGTQVVDPAQLNAAQTQADQISAESMAAFDRARRFARGRRQWQESTPGVEAALNDPNPDNFMQNFILGSGNKAQTAEVERLMHTIRRDPVATRAVTENIVAWLKSKAISGAADEVGNFSQAGYNRALNEIGDLKLRIFFTPAQISELKALGRVASYEMVQPKGSAVNNSNSAALFFGFLDKIASSGIVKGLPFGEVAISAPAKSIVNRSQVNRALNVGPAAQQAPMKLPQASEPTILEKLFGPSLLLASPRAEGGDDDRNR